ncbi:DUF7533 family protein [Haloplanus salinus]|jgi:hypothetical protein
MFGVWERRRRRHDPAGTTEFSIPTRYDLSMRLGILETVGLAASLIFAIPVGFYGIETFLAGSRPLGAGLVIVAVLMVVLPRRLTTPADLPGAVLERLVGTAVKDPDDDDQ